MKRAANVPPVVVLVLLLVLVASAGCRQTDTVQAADVDETTREAGPATTNAVRAGTTSSRGTFGGTRRQCPGGRRKSGKAQAGDAVAGGGETLLREMVKPGPVTSLPAKAVEVGESEMTLFPGG